MLLGNEVGQGTEVDFNVNYEHMGKGIDVYPVQCTKYLAFFKIRSSVWEGDVATVEKVCCYCSGGVSSSPALVSSQSLPQVDLGAKGT